MFGFGKIYHRTRAHFTLGIFTKKSRFSRNLVENFLILNWLLSWYLALFTEDLRKNIYLLKMSRINLETLDFFGKLRQNYRFLGKCSVFGFGVPFGKIFTEPEHYLAIRFGFGFGMIWCSADPCRGNYNCQSALKIFVVSTEFWNVEHSQFCDNFDWLLLFPSYKSLLVGISV